MKLKSTTRKIDNCGRVSLPMEYRRQLGIELGDDVNISMEITKTEQIIHITKQEDKNGN